jgi:hypothetical protein
MLSASSVGFRPLPGSTSRCTVVAGIKTSAPTIAPHGASIRFERVVAGFALLALLAAQWTLFSYIHGTNYAGGDGKMAQATILAAVNFTAPFQLTTLSPIQGVGSQLLPLNVWANPAYWPFHFLDKTLASDVSALIALMIFASACYVMARCFDVGVIASAIAAQLCIVMFAPMVLVLKLPTVFCINPGNAIAYAPHMVALGLLARIEPGSWRRIALISAGIFALMFYSLCCDPLWTMVDGISWSVAFAVAVLSPLHLKTIALRAAALGCCGMVLFLAGALEYLRTLSQYTARVQFPAVADRPHLFAYVSTAFTSPITEYLYLSCTLGWLLGIALLRGRTRWLCLAAAATFLGYIAYSALYLLLEGVPWTPPIPSYVEQCVFPLYVAAGVAGYWGAVGAAAQIKPPAAISSAFEPMRDVVETIDSIDIRASLQRLRSCVHVMVQQVRIAAIRHRNLRFARALLPLSRLLVPRMTLTAAGIGSEGRPRSRMPFSAILGGFIAVAVVPAALMDFARSHAEYTEYFNEPWPNEPELVAYFKTKIGRAIGQPIRGSVDFWSYAFELLLTQTALWTNAVHTIDEYSQLVSPQALYSVNAILKNNVTGALNWFAPLPGPSWDIFFKTLQVLGVRYYVADPVSAVWAEKAGFPHFTFPRRPLSGATGLWHIYEFPRPNVGDYSPTEVVIATSGPEMAAAMRTETFDFTKQVVLSKAQPQRLVPARDMRLSLIHDGFHLSGHSNGTSLVILPQQFSHCLRAHDERVRIVRADLLMAGVIFSGDVDTDILFEYGIFTPGCRRGDLADMRRLQINIDSRMPHLASDRLFLDWNGSLAKLRAAVHALK